MSDLQKQYAELKKQMKDLKKAFEKEGKEIFKKAAADYFAKHKWVKQFHWTQYTPHFNDGEPCRFRVSDDPVLNEEFDYWCKETGVTQEEFDSAADDAQSIVCSVDEDLMLALFGDGVRVILTPKSVKTEEYDHY